MNFFKCTFQLIKLEFNWNNVVYLCQQKMLKKLGKGGIASTFEFTQYFCLPNIFLLHFANANKVLGVGLRETLTGVGSRQIFH